MRVQFVPAATDASAVSDGIGLAVVSVTAASALCPPPPEPNVRSHGVNSVNMELIFPRN